MISRQYRQACECGLELLKTGYFDHLFKNIHGIIWELWESTLYINEKNASPCGENFYTLLKTKLPKTGDVKETGGRYLSEVILLDYIRKFNPYPDIVKMCAEFEARMLDSGFIENKSNFKNIWNYNLTNLYYHHKFIPGQDIKTLRANGIKLAIESGSNRTPNEIESRLLEYYAYYLLYSVNNDLVTSKNIDNYFSIIDAADIIGENSAYDAYKYIERDIVRSIQNRLTVLNNSRLLKKPAMGNSYAIVIGISDYKNLPPAPAVMDTSGFYDLKYAHKDALDFISFLNSPKSGAQWKISQFINSEAKTVELKKKIQEILIGKANPNDLIYIFFSGHGRVSDYNSNENYLLGYDFDPNDIYSQIEDDWLYKQITDSQASHIVLFVDACRSGMLQHKGGESNELFFNQVNMSSPQKIIITSGSNNQLSYESDKLQNGIFSYFLIKGLNGAAIEKDDPNVVNLDELREYLRENVCKYKKQVPAVGGKITDDTFPLSIRIPDNDK